MTIASEPEPWRALRSPETAARARAVTWVLQNPQAPPVRELMLALQAETVPRLRNNLLEVMSMRQASSATTQKLDRDPTGRAPATRSDQVDVAALVRHELSPAIGWIRLAADTEIENFGESATNDAVKKLQRRINGLIAMIKDGEELNLVSLEFPAVLLDNWPDPAHLPRIEPAPFEQAIRIESDEGLYSLLLSNVFQNALDATGDGGSDSPVHIVWGVTNESYWFRVSNVFHGERFALQDVVAVGSSTKSSHQGQGIGLIQRVAKRLDVTIDLVGASGIATFTLTGRRAFD